MPMLNGMAVTSTSINLLKLVPKNELRDYATADSMLSARNYVEDSILMWEHAYWRQTFYREMYLANFFSRDLSIIWQSTLLSKQPQMIKSTFDDSLFCSEHCWCSKSARRTMLICGSGAKTFHIWINFELACFKSFLSSLFSIFANYSHCAHLVSLLFSPLKSFWIGDIWGGKYSAKFPNF